MVVRPKAEVAPLLAIKVQSCGPDPGLAPPVFGDILVEGLQDLVPSLIVSA